jgi:hypothetical protein
MPLNLPQKVHNPEGLAGFRGVNLRLDRLSLADDACARAINADFHTRPGVALLRKGRARLSSTTLSGAVRLLATLNTRRYQIAGTTWYRDFASIRTGLSGTQAQLASYRPLNDTTTWVFLADTNGMVKDDGTTVRTWGLAAPTSAATAADGGAGSLIGNYSVKYTYVRKVGSAIAHESNPSPVSNTLAITNKVISLTGLTDSSDAQVTHKRIYRTVDTGSTWLFDSEIAQGTTTATLSKADSALGTAVETDNDRPPTCGWVVEFQGHVFFLLDPSNPHYLWYSKHFRPESVPTDQFLEVGNPSDPLNAAVRLVGLLGVFTQQTKYRVFGNATSGFTYLEALSARGTPAPQAVLATDAGALFVARDGLFVTNFLNADTLLSAAIEGLWSAETINDYAPIDFTRAGDIALTSWKQRYYLSYPTTDGATMMAVYSRETERWYFYDHQVRTLYAEEDEGLLLAGTAAGEVWSLETGSADGSTAVAYHLEPAERAGRNLAAQKRFDYVKADMDCRGGTVQLGVYVDGQIRARYALTGRRTRRLLRLPDNLLGYTWRVMVTYSGTEAIEVHGVQVYFQTLGDL